MIIIVIIILIKGPIWLQAAQAYCVPIIVRGAYIPAEIGNLSMRENLL